MITFQAGVRCERVLDPAGAEQEADLLQARVAPRERHLDGHGHDARLQAAVQRAHEVDRVVVRVHERHPVARLYRIVAGQRTAATALRRERLVQYRVSYFQRSAE